MGEPARILAVDDQEANLDLLERLLRSRGYRVLLAHDGPEALKLVAEEQPDLVLLDVHMPGMDGFEVLQRLRHDERSRSLPVVFLTADSPDQRAKIQALNLGADEYLTKPIQNNELLARVRALLRVKQFQDELEAANREKDEFISIVCHELKNPIAAIHAYSQLLDRRAHKDPALQQGLRGLDVIDRQVRRMVEMLNQLQDVSSIRMSHFKVDMQQMDLGQLVQKAVGEIRVETQPEGHPLTLELRDRALPVCADESRMRQVLDNLIGNACKYSPEGGPVVVRAELVLQGQSGEPSAEQSGEGARAAGAAGSPIGDELPAGDWACVHVQDRGIGISREEQTRLFECFYRAESGKRIASGMGLGLYIVHQIVQHHGGRMWVRSPPQQGGPGSTFSFALPLRAC